MLARLETRRCQRGVDGHVNLLISPCLTTGHSGPHKRPEEARSHLLLPADSCKPPGLEDLAVARAVQVVSRPSLASGRSAEDACKTVALSSVPECLRTRVSS